MTTHYVPAFAARAICGAIGPHSSEPTCETCKALIYDEELFTRDDEAALLKSNQWNAVLMPPDVAAALEQPIPSSPCLDSSTANCVPGEFNPSRCRSCRRELK